MVRWTRIDVLPSVIALGSACVQNPGHHCDDDAQCLLADGGRCEAGGACSYPDPKCPSRRRYGKWAPGDLANVCVPADSSGSSTDDSTGDPMPDGPAVRDGRVPGTIVWEQIYDGRGAGSDRGHALQVDAGGESFYVAGIVVTDPTRSADVVVQRRAVATGALEWTWTASHSALADEARDLTLAADGSVVVIGTVAGTADDDIWMSKFAPDDDAPTWELVHDHDGSDDRSQGVTIASNGSIVGVGWTRGANGDDALFVQVNDAGVVEASTVMDLSEGAGTDRLHDVVADGDDLLVTGFRREGGADAYNVWTARYDLDLVELSHAVIDPPNSGNANRGIRIARAPDGAVGVAGSLTDNRHLWLYRDPSTLAVLDATSWTDGDLHDEATDVAFAPDGSFVVVGVLDFRQGGTPDDESDDDSEWWVGAYDPDGEPRWETRDPGFVDPPGTDRALAVVVVNEMAIVTGYLVTEIDTGGKAIWTVAYAL